MKKIIFKFADDPRHNVADEFDVEKVFKFIKKIKKDVNVEGYHCILIMLNQTFKMFKVLDLRFDRMIINEDLTLFVRKINIEDEYVGLYYDFMREDLDSINKTISETLEYYS